MSLEDLLIHSGVTFYFFAILLRLNAVFSVRLDLHSFNLVLLLCLPYITVIFSFPESQEKTTYKIWRNVKRAQYVA